MSHRRVHFIFKLKKKKQKKSVEADTNLSSNIRSLLPLPKQTHIYACTRTISRTHARTHMLTQGRLETVESVRSNGQTKSEC